MTSMITEIIGSEYEGDDKWSGMVKGNDNCLYCLPHDAKQLLKIDPSNDETILVGEEYDGDGKWCNGFARGDCIYLIPSKANRFLKYNIKTGISELVGDDFGDNYGKWISGAVADDGCLYCFPYSHNRILKFNPNDDTTIFVGEEIEGDCTFSKFSGTIKAKNGCIYGIPSSASRVAKFNVASQNVTFIGDEYEDETKWMGGVEGMDDNIYGILSHPYEHNQWLKIDIVTDTISLFGEGEGYNGGVIGEDCDVYAIPAYAINVTKFSTTTQEMLEVGNRCGDEDGGGDKWSGGVLHSNGYIYCAPHCNNKVLKIKTNYIRDEGKRLLESNASLTEFNRYLNTYQFEYIYVSHKDLYDRIVSYRNNLIFESAKLALERSSAVKNESVTEDSSPSFNTRSRKRTR